MLSDFSYKEKYLCSFTTFALHFMKGRRGHKRRNKPRKNPHDLDDPRLQDLGFDLPADKTEAAVATASDPSDIPERPRKGKGRAKPRKFMKVSDINTLNGKWHMKNSGARRSSSSPSKLGFPISLGKHCSRQQKRRRLRQGRGARQQGITSRLTSRLIIQGGARSFQICKDNGGCSRPFLCANYSEENLHLLEIFA